MTGSIWSSFNLKCLAETVDNCYQPTIFAPLMKNDDLYLYPWFSSTKNKNKKTIFTLQFSFESDKALMLTNIIGSKIKGVGVSHYIDFL